MVENVDVCSICLTSVSETPIDMLVHPCACTNRPVHLVCLQKWNLSRPVRSDMLQCEVCTQTYWGGKWRQYATMVGVWLVESGRRFVGGGC